MLTVGFSRFKGNGQMKTFKCGLALVPGLIFFLDLTPQFSLIFM